MSWIAVSCALWLSSLGHFGPMVVIEVPLQSAAVKVGTLGLELEGSPDAALVVDPREAFEGDAVGSLGLALESSPVVAMSRPIGTLWLELEDSPPYPRARVRATHRSSRAGPRDGHRLRSPRARRAGARATGSLSLPLE